MTVSARTLRNQFLVGASLATLMVAGSAHAQNLGAGRTANPAVAAAQASQNAAQRNAAAQAAAARTRASFEQASRVRQQMDAAQAAAREAARVAQSNVPNGLGAGGLQVANGVEIDSSLWVGANGPSQSQGENGRTNITIEQTQEKAILTWDSFNVGRETDLRFDQQGNTNWVALNRVTSASADPSRILGSIRGDGSVYIINPNGVLFGGASQVNVRNLVASSLDINAPTVAARDQRFLDGLFGDNKQDMYGTFRGQMTFWDGVTAGSSDEVETAAQSIAPGVTVSAGARIETADSGIVMLVGRNVDNSGVISAPSGQVLLAAGRGVTMVDGPSRAIGSSYAWDGDSRSEADLFKIPGYIAVVQQGGRATNNGLLESTLGSISMTGASVLQNGVITATTGVERAGSVILDASSLLGFSGTSLNINGDPVGAGIRGWRGEVTIGADSHVSILPDEDGQTAPGSSFTLSNVEIVGNQIVFEQGSVLWAPSAALYLTASRGSGNATASPGRIYLDHGATVDVSGLNGVEVDMEQNSVRAELRANELADNPVIRDGNLRGETVWFDGRLGDRLTDGTGIGDLSGWYDLIQRDVTQFMTTGGSVTMKGAEIITREGSTIDISGGSVIYNDGFVRRTQLIDQYGRLVPIEEAVAGVNYVGVEGDSVVSHTRWGVSERFTNPFSRVSQGSWEHGYVEGRSAGSLTLHAGQYGGSQNVNGFNFTGDLARIFEGEVKAGVIVGEHQVDAPTGAGVTDVSRIWRERPSLGQLTIGEMSFIGLRLTVNGGDIVVAERTPVLGAGFASDTALFDSTAGYAPLVDGVSAGRHVLSADWFDGKTFGDVTIYSGDSVTNLYSETADGWVLKPDAPTDTTGGVLTIGAGVTVDLGDYGSFNFIGRQANIDGTIRAAGGDVSLEGTWLPKAGTSDATFSSIPDSLRPGVTLGATAVIDVAGRWTNNWLEARAGEPLTNAVIDGGSVNLHGYRINLADGSLIDVSGGASLATDGATLSLGDGGSVTLNYDTQSSIGLQPGGELVMEGTLVGHAPGAGGTLNIYAPHQIFITEDWESFEPISDGVLEAGTAAPRDVTLSEALTVPTGSVLGWDTEQRVMEVLRGGEVLASQTIVTANNTTNAVALQVDWVIPAGMTVRTTTTSPYDTNQTIVGDGVRTLKAGTTLRSFSTSTINGTLPAGFEVPRGVFRYADGTEGLKLQSAGALVSVPAGTPLYAPVTLAAGTTLTTGTVLDLDAPVDNNFRLVTPGFFQGDAQGAPVASLISDKASISGFANFGLTGALGLTVTSGTVITPAHDTLQLTGATRDIATGTNLAGLASIADSGVSLVRSTDLPQWRRQATDLILGTQPVAFETGDPTRSGWGGASTRRAGGMVIEAGAELRMEAESGVVLASTGRMSVDGLIETLGGEISLQTDLAGRRSSADIVVGDNARLLAGGYEAVVAYVDGREVRAVAAGGRVQIGQSLLSRNTGENGARVLIGDGAVLDVAGVAGTADLPSGGSAADLSRAGATLLATPVHGAGGEILINAYQGQIAGDLRLAPGGETGLGGRLAIYSIENANILIRDSITDIAPTTVSSAIPTGALTLAADRISASGADDLAIGGIRPEANGQVAFSGDVRLSARRSIVIETRRLTAADPGTIDEETGEPSDTDVTIESAYVRLTGADNSSPLNNVATRHSLTVRAGLIDLVDVLALGNTAAASGFATTDLVSDGDIRLVSRRNNGQGGLNSNGAIRFDAAQVYVAPGVGGSGSSNENFVQFDRAETAAGYLVSSPISIEVDSNGAPAPVPLAWGGKLTLRAPEIVQAGVLRAPLGTIVLDATNDGQITLAPGSLTSVSLEGGTALAGLMTSTGQFLGYARDDWSPSKAVVLSGGDVDLQGGAVVDLSGGGDLLGYSFAAGAGGLNNVLDSGVDGAAFAILPGYQGPTPTPVTSNILYGYAAWQTDTWATNDSGTADGRLRVGDQVYLAGISGLADGYYTLLPAAHALQEGGMLIRPAGGPISAGPQASLARDDGSVVVSGFRAVAGTAIRPDQGWSSFQVMNGDTWRRYSAITTYGFNALRAATNAETGLLVRTPHDAGRLVIEATDALALLGQVHLAGGEAEDGAGLVGDIDISNPGGGVALVEMGQLAPEGYLALDAETLQNFGGAGSLLLGGRRPITTYVTGVDLSTLAPAPEGVAITTTASDVLIADGVQYTGLELLLAATDTITIGRDAGLVASGSGRTNDSKVLTTGDGALLRLSTGARADLVRNGGTGASGSISIGSGAALESAGALLLDASAGFDLPADALLDVGSLDLASDRINIGDTPAGTAGTIVSLDTIERLAGASDLLLRAHQGLALWGDFTLGQRNADGTATLGSLIFDAPVIEGHAAGTEAPTVIAENLTLRNSGGVAAYETGAAVLTLDVDRLALGNGSTGFSGYAGVAGRVGEIVAEGNGDLLIAGDLDLSVDRITAATGAEYGVSASGRLSLRHGTAGLEPADGAGGRLSFAGTDLLFDTTAVSPAGLIALSATGGDLTLGQNAGIDVSGVAKDFIDTVRYAPGGNVTLSATGDIAAHSTSRIDVSGHERGGSAGVIDVQAGGSAALDGELVAESADGHAGGEFVLDAAGTDFSALNAKLNAGHFTASRDIRLDQAITLAAGERLEAHKVSLHSNNGDVRIAGVIAASGDAVEARGGVVRLTGANVLIDPAGRIEAAAAAVDAKDFQPAGGVVTLAADEGRVTMASGASIDLSGGREGGGRLMIRAARLANGVDADTSASVAGAREKVLVGSRVYQADTVDAALIAAARNDAGTWLEGLSAPAGWESGAGIVFRGAGDLTVADDVDLSGIAGAGYLGLQAGGDLLVSANVSDGFDGASAAAALQSGQSSSYGLEAGRDIVLDQGVIVRTGVGDITAKAGRDLRIGAEAVIYTAGRATETEPGFIPAGGAYPTQGGELHLSAGRDIIAAPIEQTPTAWLFRYGDSSWNGNPDQSRVLQQTSWSVVFSNYQFGVGALGGGDVSIRANGDLRDLAVALPTTGHMTTPVGGHAVSDDLVVRGGGDLNVRALGDIGGGSFVLGRGKAHVIAGGDVTGGATLGVINGNASNDIETRGLAPLFGLMDATVSLQAARGIEVEGVYDLGLVPQICENMGVLLCTATQGQGVGSSWVAVSDRSAFDAVAAGGGVLYRGNSTAAVTLSRNNRNDGAGGAPNFRVTLALTPPQQSDVPSSYIHLLQRTPGTLRLAAMEGDLRFITPLTISAAPRGTFEFLAKGDITFTGANGGSDTGLSHVILENVGVDYIRNALRPAAAEGQRTVDIFAPRSDRSATIGNNYYRGYDLLHASDYEPARLYALQGSIGMSGGTLYDRWKLLTPKAVRIQAGEDIGIATLSITHNRASDLSTVIAGRDIQSYGSGFNGYHIYGEGDLWIEAGRNLLHDLAASPQTGSFVSEGNGSNGGDYLLNDLGQNTNYALPDIGADMHIVTGTGQGADYVSFADLYLNPTNLANPEFGLSHPTNQGKVVKTYEAELAAWMFERDGFATSEALADFLADNGLTRDNLGDRLTELGIDRKGSNWERLARLLQRDFNLFAYERSGQDEVVELSETQQAFFGEARQRFDGLPQQTREIFLQQVLIDELRQTGIDYNDADGPRFQQYTRGYSALHLLYTATEGLGRNNPLGGDIMLRNATVESVSGGSINLIAPYGRIGVGNPVDPLALEDAGIVTRRGGDISILANDTISLDQSRVFTLQGGDLMMWTSNGDITAGTGAKTNVTNVPLRFLLNRDGLLSVNVFGLQTGAGIGVLDAFEGRDPGRVPSRMDLLAFFGEVNAGDAGIRVVGDINIAALRVVNAANIEVSGEAVGIPQVPAVNMGALNAASAATSAVVNEAAQLAERSRPQVRTEMPTILSVRFLGFGE